ncbi:MAG TPA: uroporphyrinogen-III synthase [Xanthomonadaceae bacterium]|nr:uroporphyrinogen-III synthase [Xanthomonadaceae bacterium]
MQSRESTPGWYVISLRPRGEHAAVRRVAARHGAGVLALSPWALRPRDDAVTRAALARALAAPRAVFTSPAAVRAAAALQRLTDSTVRDWLAVGAGTAAALRRAGIATVHVPARMDSEGLLALPALQAIDGSGVGLVTAPDGRGVLAAALESRGARVCRADVYVREPVRPPARAVQALLALRVPAVVLLSSGGALAALLDGLAPLAQDRLRGLAVVAASDRLQALATAEGFAPVLRAAGPRPAQLLASASALVSSASMPASFPGAPT